MSEEIKNEEATDTAKTDQVEETKTTEEEEFENYNGFKVQRGTTEAVNKRVASETHKLKEKYNTTQEQLNTLQQQLEEMKLNSMTEKERLAHEEEQRKVEEEKLKNQVEEYGSKYKNYFRDTELHNAISKFDVVNPKQVLNLIKSEYKTEFEENEDGINLHFNNGSNKVTVEEAVKNFLDDPSNSNLIRSNLRSGSGTKTSNQSKTELRTSFKRSEIADPNSEAAKEYNQALKQGLRPELV